MEMKCFGVTKEFKRCKKHTKFLLCNKHKFQWFSFIGSLLALFSTIVGLIVDFPSIVHFQSTKEKSENIVGYQLIDTLGTVSVPPSHLLAKSSDCFDSINYRGITILKEERVYDFRKHSFTNNANKTILISPVTLKRTLYLKRNLTAEKFIIRFSTSGNSVYARCANRDFLYCVPKKVTMADPGKTILMKSIDIIVDIKSKPPSDTIMLIYEATYYNGFQNINEEWIGTSILGARMAKDFSMLCYFNERNRPVKVRFCGYKAYNDTCFDLKKIHFAYSQDSLSFGWRYLNNSSESFDGIDCRWIWKQIN